MRNNKCLVTPNPKPNAKVKLICFPYAGGGISTYNTWAKHLPENVELTIVQLPGRGERMFETPYSNMSDVMNELLNVMPNHLNTPYIVFGHSLGSRIAFELLVKLQEMKLPLPLHFIASGSRGPHSHLNKKNMYNLPEQAFITELKNLNGTPKAVLENKELMDLFLPVLRADFELSDTYCYNGNAQFNCLITVLGGINDIDISREQLQSWQDFFVPNLHLYMIPGNHFFIDTHQGECLDKVNSIIKSAFPTAHD